MLLGNLELMDKSEVRSTAHKHTYFTLKLEFSAT
jgi:hypothetical protein